MKPLLSKTTRPFLVYVLIVFLVSVPAYYFVVNAIWEDELDEHNRIIADKSAYSLNQLQLPEQELQKLINFWNRVQPGSVLYPAPGEVAGKDSLYTIEKKRAYSTDEKPDRYRCLSLIILVNNKPYRLIVETNIEEAREIIVVIAVTTIFFFIVIVIGLLVLNRRLSKTAWQPFRAILDQLKTFNLNTQTRIAFEKTNTTEFEELNQSLSKLIEQNVSAYKTQKEFTENASHELQTPLAILRNKIDVLLQDKDLTEKQYDIVEDMNKALTRSSRINKNLLLLARIDNNQFDNIEPLQFDSILQQCINALKEHTEQKNIVFELNIQERVFVNGNITLTEVLINNLLINAIRHSPENGRIMITLNPSFFEIVNSGEKELDNNLLFKRFSKLSKLNNGSGLGLAIIQQICKVQGYTVHYRFEPGWHCFRITF